MGCEGILLGEGRGGPLECSTRDGKGGWARGGSELTDLPLGPKSSGPGRAEDGVPGPTSQWALCLCFFRTWKVLDRGGLEHDYYLTINGHLTGPSTSEHNNCRKS